MKVTHLIFKYLFLFTLLLGIVGCEKEIQQEIESIETVQNKNVVDVVEANLTELLDTKIYLEQKAKSHIKTKSSGRTYLETSYGLVDLDQALKVINESGDGNLSFKIIPNTYQEGIIYNLVVTPPNKSGDREAFITKYVIDNHNQTEENAIDEPKPFSGQMYKYAFDIALLSKGDCPPDDFLPPNDDPVNGDSGTTGSSGGGSSTGSGSPTGSGPSGSDPLCASYTTFIQCCGPNANIVHTPTECGCGSRMGSYWVTYVECYGDNDNKSMTKGSCPEVDTSDPIVINDMLSIYQIALLTQLEGRISERQEDWILNPGNLDEVTELFFLGKDKNWSEEAKEFANLTIASFTSVFSLERQFAKELLDAITNNTDFDFAPYLNPNAVPLREGINVNGCPNPPCWGSDEEVALLWEFGPQLVRDGISGIIRLCQISFEYGYPDRIEGSYVRTVMTNLGLDIPDDIPNELLGELFSVRTIDLQPRIFGNQSISQDMISAGIAVIDVVSLLTPSRGGGAFLAARGGGIITKPAVVNYLEILARGSWKTFNENMSDAAKTYQEFISGRVWNQSFELNGVKFDVLKNGVLGDAKSGMLNFVNPNGTFKPFFTGQQSIISQANRQRQAAGDLPIEWHFEHDIVRQAFKNLLEPLGHNIKFIHTPR